MWGFFQPKRTVLSVIQELVEGVEQGTVALPCPEEELSATDDAPDADDGEVRRVFEFLSVPIPTEGMKDA
jgi:hypothetical protein